MSKEGKKEERKAMSASGISSRVSRHSKEMDSRKKISTPSDMSSIEATDKLRALCHKFSILTEKVQEETRIRQEAEKEIERLKRVLEEYEDATRYDSISMCGRDDSAIEHMNSVQHQLQLELRREKEKNDSLVRQALNLEKEKHALLQQCKSEHERYAKSVNGSAECLPLSPSSSQAPAVKAGNDMADQNIRNKINETLKMTVIELEEELNRKEREMESLSQRFDRERAKAKQLQQKCNEHEAEDKERLNSKEQHQNELDQAQVEIARLQCSLDDKSDHCMSIMERNELLYEQMNTLQEVNEALEKRCSMLLRRFDANSFGAKEIADLKEQLHDAEGAIESYRRQVEDQKTLQSQRDLEWKKRLATEMAAKGQLEESMKDLDAALKDAKQRNDLLSEWMLVRSDHCALTDSVSMSDRCNGKGLSSHARNRQTERVPKCHCVHKDFVMEARVSPASRNAFESKKSHCQYNRSKYDASYAPCDAKPGLEKDQDRLRLLMVRNRELQQRLSQAQALDEPPSASEGSGL